MIDFSDGTFNQYVRHPGLKGYLAPSPACRALHGGL